LLAYCFVSFVAFGIVLVLVGANQADMARDLDLDLSRTGLLASALALGIGAGVVGAGPLYDRLPRRPLFVLSMFVAGVALVSVTPTMGFGRWIGHLIVIGLGIGAYDTLINASIVQRFGSRSSRPMTAIHSAAAVGAIAGPFLVAAVVSTGHWTESFRWTGAGHLALAGLAFAVGFPAPERAARATTPRRVLGIAILPFALIAFAYVGIEAALTVFAEPYADFLGLGAQRGSLAISSVWLGLLIGRLAVLILPADLDSRLLGVAGIASGAILLGGIGWRLEAVEGVFFAVGCCLGCVYPLMIALAGQRFPHAPGTAAGVAAGAGALGGFAVPWLTGALGDGIDAGFAVASLALWSLLIALAAAAAMRFR
jgi:fucose permease